MSQDEIRTIWSITFWEAIGCGEDENAAEALANKRIAPYVAAQKRAEHFARHPSGRVPQPNQAGIRQRKERHCR